MHVKRSKSQADRAIWALAARQHGVVSRAQLLALGVNRGAITHRIELGRLQPVHRGVYRIGLLSRDGRRMAAVLACGPDAVLSHLAAAALFGIRQSDRIEVTTRTTCRGPNRVIVHRSPLRDDERTTHRGIPTNGPTNTPRPQCCSSSRRPTQRTPPGRAAPPHRPALAHRSRRALPAPPGPGGDSCAPKGGVHRRAGHPQRA
jgi:hypothetical protein